MGAQRAAAQRQHQAVSDDSDRAVAVTRHDKAPVVSQDAIDHDLTLKKAALDNGVSEELCDRVVDPLTLTQGGSADLASPAKHA